MFLGWGCSWTVDTPGLWMLLSYMDASGLWMFLSYGCSRRSSLHLTASSEEGGSKDTWLMTLDKGACSLTTMLGGNHLIKGIQSSLVWWSRPLVPRRKRWNGHEFVANLGYILRSDSKMHKGRVIAYRLAINVTVLYSEEA